MNGSNELKMLTHNVMIHESTQQSEIHKWRFCFWLNFSDKLLYYKFKFYNIINVVQIRDWHRTIWKMVIQKNRSQQNTATKLYCIYFYNIYLESDGSWIDSNDDRWSAKLPAFYLILSDTKTLYHTWFFSYAWPRISKLNNFVARKKKHFYSPCIDWIENISKTNLLRTLSLLFANCISVFLFVFPVHGPIVYSSVSMAPMLNTKQLHHNQDHGIHCPHFLQLIDWRSSFFPNQLHATYTRCKAVHKQQKRQVKSSSEWIGVTRQRGKKGFLVCFLCMVKNRFINIITAVSSKHYHAICDEEERRRERKKAGEKRRDRIRITWQNSTLCATWHDACFRFKEFATTFCGLIGILIVSLAILFAVAIASTARTFAPSTVLSNLTIVTCYAIFISTMRLFFFYYLQSISIFTNQCVWSVWWVCLCGGSGWLNKEKICIWIY